MGYRQAQHPDIAYRVLWNGTEIREAKAPGGDQLIAEWDLLSMNLIDAVRTRQVEVSTAINAPLVKYVPGGMLRIEVWDRDVTYSDEAGTFDLTMDTLVEGLNVFEPSHGGVAKLVLDLVPRSLPIPDLLERASNR